MSIERVATTPVSGVVFIDGVPAANLQVECHPDESGLIRYSITAMTDDAGNFRLSTYEANDGLPEGHYLLTFRWFQPGIAPLDKLNGAYADPAKSTFFCDVKRGIDSPIGKIELSSR